MIRRVGVDAIILAGGKSSRMKSTKSKVLHCLMGKPMIFFPVNVARSVTTGHILLVVNPEHEKDIRKAIDGDDLMYFTQKEPKGTGHAVLQTKEYFKDKDVDVLVIPGDAPLLRPKTIKSLYRFHKNKKANITVLTAELPNPTGYGRIVREKNDLVAKIIEEKDATQTERLIKEVNSGVYFFKSKYLFEALKQVNPENQQSEYYLTDVLEITQHRVGGVFAFKVEDYKEILGVNTRKQLSEARKIMQERINNYWMNNGVTIIDPDSTYIEWEVELAQDVVIYPFTALLGKTKIGSGAVIGPNITLADREVSPGQKVGLN